MAKMNQNSTNNTNSSNTNAKGCPICNKTAEKTTSNTKACTSKADNKKTQG